MSMALATPQPSVTMQDWEVMRSQAAMLVTTGFLPSAVKTPEQAVAIILTGREVGIPTMAALNTINVIQGKPTISPQLMLALIYRSKQAELIEVEESTDTRCIVNMKRVGQPAHKETFTIGDAQRITTTEYVNGEKKSIRLADKYNWKSMPNTMLRWRAIAACARIVFPDIILGLYTPEEMGANVEVNDEGEMQVLPDPIGPNAEATQATLARSRAIPPRSGTTLERFAEPEPPAHVEPATGEIIEQPDLLGEPSITDPAHPHWKGWLKLVALAEDNENIASSDIPELHLPIRISDLGDAGAALKAQLKAFQTTR